MARRRKGRDVHGWLVVDKPAGITSNAALQEAKSLLGARKGGHTGSLDPIATGLLPLCQPLAVHRKPEKDAAWR